uniref:ABC transporter ATP-binding protein n=1 Tax=Nonomuraea pusilla TaxID=46177 RepID=UPI0006E223AD|nr:ATP-binding cassette domain-containing protein [Nonomuraea pusilla]
MLQVSGLEHRRGGVAVLAGISLEVAQGRIACVVGERGSGKTALLDTVMGVRPATAGSVRLRGADVTALRPQERARLGMAYVPHGHRCFPQLSVLGNLLVAAEAAQQPREALDEALDVLPALRPLLNRTAGNLPVGGRQQLALARALVTRPALLLLDEPADGLQPRAASDAESALAGLRDRGVAMLVAERRPRIAARLADTSAVLTGGRLAMEPYPLAGGRLAMEPYPVAG